MFFNQFPKRTYSVENDGIVSVITDYFRYVDIVERLATNVYAYKTVDLIDGERPDNLSLRLYGTTDYYWTFFIANDHLKEGLSAWPKSDQEITQHITNQYSNLSAFRFPYFTQGNLTITPLGIPMTDERYQPYLYLCNLMATLSDGERVFAKAKIVDYKPELSQIWIDQDTISWYSEDETMNESVGSGTSLDQYYQKSAAKNLFYSTESAYDFSVQFHSDGTDEANVLRKSFIAEVREPAMRFRSFMGFDTMDYGTVDKNYNILSTQYWKDGSLAPAHYYDAVDTDEQISEYEAGYEATNYTSLRDEMIDKNNSLKTIKVVDSRYIESFAREYKRLLNE